MTREPSTSTILPDERSETETETTIRGFLQPAAVPGFPGQRTAVLRSCIVSPRYFYNVEFDPGSG